MGDPHMIPGADMFNHDPNKQAVQIGTDGEDYFVMKTVRLGKSQMCSSASSPRDEAASVLATVASDV